MNIRDSYIHGADGKGVVKRLFFATAADVTANSDLHVNDLVFLLADTLGTQVPLTIPTLNQNTDGYASSLLVVESASTSNHYLTFVDSNNTTAEAESFYTSGDIYFKPSTGVLTVKSVTVNNTFNYAGIGSDTTSNAARKIWFASSSDGTPVVSDNFKYNPSTKTLTVDKISGPTIVIGNTTLYLDGANNVLTPDTVISNTSTNNTIPSSKAVWDAILTGIQANDAMVFKGFLTGGADAAHTTYTPGADRGDTYKVQTAGYINGEYYQVNDTFICTTDGTNAASSSTSTADMNAIKANWGVVEGNGDYLSIHGGTMSGLSPINFANNKIAILFRHDYSNCYSRILYMTSGNEALVFSNAYAATSFIFKCGYTLTDGSDWNVQFNENNIPSIQIKHLSLYVNSLIGTSVTPGYNFLVNGTSYLGGNTTLNGSLTWATTPDNITNPLYILTIDGTDNGVTKYTTIANLKTALEMDLFVPKRHNNGYYPFITSCTRGTYYKIVLPWYNYTGGDAWMMNTMEIVLGGSHNRGSFGRIYLQYYFKKATNGGWSAEFVRGIAIGHRISENDISIKYDLAQPGIFYIKVTASVYNSIGIENLTANDTASSYDFRDTTIETISASNIPSSVNQTVPLYHAITTSDVSSSNATIGTSLTTIATLKGVNIQAKIGEISSLASQLVEVTKTLKVTDWTDMKAINTEDAGTYVIQISSGNVIASGIFTMCGGTDSVTDEIPLHVSDKGTNTWRPYARISSNNLLMTTNEASPGTSRKYTIKILKLI